MNNHERLQTDIAAYALDSVTRDEAIALEHELVQHLPGCDDCRTLLADLRDTATDLAMDAQPVPPSDLLEERIRRAIGDEGLSIRTSVTRRGPRRGLAVAMIAALLAVPTAWGLNLAGRLERAERRADSAVALQQLVADPASRTVALRGAGDPMTLLYRPGGDALLLADPVTAPPEGKVYELWFIRKGTPIPVGVFTPSDGVVALSIRSVPRGAEVVAVTVERSFVSQPTTAPILVGQLT